MSVGGSVGLWGVWLAGKVWAERLGRVDQENKTQVGSDVGSGGSGVRMSDLWFYGQNPSVYGQR